MMKVVLASGNRHKYTEIKRAMDEAGVELIFGGDFEAPVEVEENGTTYAENSLLKSHAWAKKTGLPALADDSGIEVYALDGQPGIHSARAAEGSDKDRVSWLLSQMADKTDRKAAFVCCATVAFPDAREDMVCEERCEGSLAYAESGVNGFGYDPVFIPDGYDKTFGELSAEVKLKISHRAKALKGIAKMLDSVVKFHNVRTKENSPLVQRVGVLGEDR